MIDRSSERDRSLALIDELSEVTSDIGPLVVTGSYSIDALTNRNVTHNDIDTNLFVKDLDEGYVAETASALERHFPVAEKRLSRQDRLEYILGSTASSGLVELQFIDYEEKLGNDYTLHGHNGAGERIIAPLVGAEVKDSRGAAYEFKVKSLSYAIATWAIRISGLLDYQKRPVRQSDIDHYNLLLEQPHDLDDIRRAITHHPQMIATTPDLILQSAAKIAGENHG